MFKVLAKFERFIVLNNFVNIIHSQFYRGKPNIGT